MKISHHLAQIICFICLLPAISNTSAFTFAALGDTQNTTDKGITQINDLIESINQHQPEFVVHIGELKGGSAPCPDQYYQRIIDTSHRFNMPLIFVPGDNDWTDCFQSNSDPIERLEFLRNKLYHQPQSLGKAPMSLNRQSKEAEFSKFVENVWWENQGVVFASFHNVGTNNNLYSNRQAVEEHLERNKANLAWLDKIFSKASKAKALVLFTHANIHFDAKPWQPTGFDDFRQSLSNHVSQFGRPVLFVHGDTHQHKIDKPLKFKNKTVANFTRLEVFGTPDLGVIYVHVDTNTESVFKFEPVASNLIKK